MTVKEGLEVRETLSTFQKPAKQGKGELPWTRGGSTRSLSGCKSAVLVDNRLSSGLMIASFQMEMSILTPLPEFFFSFFFF